MAEALLSLEGLVKSFDQTRVLDGLSLTVGEGEFVTLLGPSGCGKTTTLRVIAGLTMPDEGRVVIGGEDVTLLAPEKRPVNTVFQNYALFPHMNVAKNISYGMRIRGATGRRWKPRVRELLKLVQLEGYEKRMPSELSGGQRQRLGIARALIMEPEFIIADEPISALDVSIRAQVLNLLNKFQRERGTTYLFIAHDLSIVRFISDRIGVIYKGEIVEIAEAEELFAYPLHPYTRSLISAIPIPDPKLEKKKKLFVYDPSQHDYSEDKPEMVCIGHNHYIFGNKKEIEEYKRIREEGVPLKSSSFMTEQEALEYAEKEAEEPVEATEPILDTPVHDTGSSWFKVLSFFLPIPGIIAAYIFKKFNYIKNFKAFKKGAIAGFIFLAVLLVLFLFFLLLTLR